MTTPQGDWRERLGSIYYNRGEFKCDQSELEAFIATEIAAAENKERLRHCCCVIEDSKVIEFCKLHSDLIKAAEELVYHSLGNYLQHDTTCYLYTEEGYADQCDCGLYKALSKQP